MLSDLVEMECSAQCLVHRQHSKNTTIIIIISLPYTALIRVIAISFLLRVGLREVIHAHSSTQIGQLARVPGTLCPCALIPSWHGATHSHLTVLPFLCLFVLSCLRRVDAISLMQAPRHRICVSATCLVFILQGCLIVFGDNGILQMTAESRMLSH